MSPPALPGSCRPQLTAAQRRGRTALFALLLGLAINVAADAPAESVQPDQSASGRDFLYETEYPEVGYTHRTPTDRVAQLRRRWDETPGLLTFRPGSGYLQAVLEALDIDESSQVLVFSKTSLNAALISPANPRALFFNDDTYLGYVPGADELEIASMDVNLGPVFYSLGQREVTPPLFDRQTVRCLRCHDSMSLTGGGVPRFITGSGYVDTSGNIVGHEGWILTDQRTPLRFRWGGWYVTGLHGAQPHLGNILVEDPQQLRELDSLRVYNLESLEGRVELSAYPADSSDIVALLVLEHQVHVQNLVARLLFATRSGTSPPAGVGASSIDDIVTALVAALVFEGAPEFDAPVRGAGEFLAAFLNRGPFDESGRSLREFDLATKLFRYPVSYLLQTTLLDGLPAAIRARVYREVAATLIPRSTADTASEHGRADSLAAIDILAETVNGFAEAAGLMADY